MPIKKDGMSFEVHPTPIKGKDGKNIVYARPAEKAKLTMEGLEDYCERNYNSRYGELSRAFDFFLRAAAELMARGCTRSARQYDAFDVAHNCRVEFLRQKYKKVSKIPNKFGYIQKKH